MIEPKEDASAPQTQSNQTGETIESTGESRVVSAQSDASFVGLNLGDWLRRNNLEAALKIAKSIPRDKNGSVVYASNKELARWQAAAVVLAQEFERK